MLAKLIKYDIKALSEKYCLMLVALALTGIIGSLLTFTGNDTLIGILLFIAFLFTIVVATVFIVLALIYLYSTLSGKKSGFTYTLPVKTSYIVLSKQISVIIWFIITAAIVILFWIVFYKSISANSSILNSVIDSIKNEIFTAFGEDRFYGILLIFVTDLIFQFLGAVSVIIFCISLTCFPKFKNKNIGVAAGVIGYFLITYALNILYIIILVIFNRQEIFSNAQLGAEETFNVIRQISVIVIAGWSIVSVILYFLSSKMFSSYKNV